MRVIQYAVQEAMASLWRGRRSVFLSTATISLALFVLGGCLLVTSNLDRLGDDWGRAVELSVYLKDGATAPERTAIESVLTPGSVVAAREYVSKEEALARFKQTFADLAGTIDTLGENPLPASYEVRLQPGAAAQTAIEGLVARLRQAEGVADVRYDRDWLDRLLRSIAIIRDIGLGLGSILTLAAVLTIATVVRLALHARRDEIAIMQLVGAPHAYIRGPFLMEGLLQGGAGALTAVLLLGMSFLALRPRYLGPLASAINLSSLRFLSIDVCTGLILGGMAVGCAGGLVATWERR